MNEAEDKRKADDYAEIKQNKKKQKREMTNCSINNMKYFNRQ